MQSEMEEALGPREPDFAVALLMYNAFQSDGLMVRSRERETQRGMRVANHSSSFPFPPLLSRSVSRRCYWRPGTRCCCCCATVSPSLAVRRLSPFAAPDSCCSDWDAASERRSATDLSGCHVLCLCFSSFLCLNTAANGRPLFLQRRSSLSLPPFLSLVPESSGFSGDRSGFPALLVTHVCDSSDGTRGREGREGDSRDWCD